MKGEEGRPWEQPGAVRRDCQPHQGPVLLLMANAALVCNIIAFCTGISAVPGIALAPVVLVMGGRELEQMAAGWMDPAGRSQVQEARGWAWVALCLGVLGALVGFAIFSSLFPMRIFVKTVLGW
jgi:hypothetical protein